MIEKLILLQIQITPELNKRLGFLTIHLDKRSKRQLAAELLEKAVEELEKQQKNEVK
jgi:predicted DNA-binding protein